MFNLNFKLHLEPCDVSFKLQLETCDDIKLGIQFFLICYAT